jgi:hypothetical protein
MKKNSNIRRRVVKQIKALGGRVTRKTADIPGRPSASA